MKIGAMIGDVIQSLFRMPVTERYPQERQPAPESLRAKLTFDPDGCIGCCLCVKECPSNSIEVLTIDKENKRFVARYHIDRCTFCAQCVKNCRFGCLNMTSDQWELAALDKMAFTVYYGDHHDIDRILGKIPEEIAAPV